MDLYSAVCTFLPVSLSENDTDIHLRKKGGSKYAYPFMSTLKLCIVPSLIKTTMITVLTVGKLLLS
jgi:hypothetical protein